MIAPGDEEAQLLGFKAGGQIDPEPSATNDALSSEVPTATVAGERILAAAPGLVLLDGEGSEAALEERQGAYAPRRPAHHRRQ